MRKLLTCCLLAGLLFSCSKKSNPDTPAPEEHPKTYTVKLGVAAEITEVKSSLSASQATATPLVLASNDLMAIQVYSRVQGTAGTYNPFAYALFDNTGNISLGLLGGYEYKFVANIVVDGKTKIYHSYNGYGAPFSLSNLTTNNVTNNFITSATVYYINIEYGYSYLPSGLSSSSYYYRPNIDRYYGETAGYVPSENGTVTVNTKRTVFGAKFVASGLTDGQLKIEMKDGPTQYISTTTPATTIQDIFSFHQVQQAWATDTYTETIPVTITWIKSDATVVPLGTKDITFQRNMLSTINITVSNTSRSSGVAITQESTPMGTGTTTNF
ncbi:hypothetical protein [Niabella soli]|uniref:DUF4595 domain-containing protein n=1 Tax=Niabella soli DSM 19437 TaxID=929713 RepID=W0F7W6_9BACT|nr:hypothetical protein [Niabella soli]AHF17903.1 hypothetical protein NIASO_16290 [Niabella soli DSM 19437]